MYSEFIIPALIIIFIVYKTYKEQNELRLKVDRINELADKERKKYSDKNWSYSQKTNFDKPKKSHKNISLKDISFSLNLKDPNLGTLFIKFDDDQFKWVIIYYTSNMEYFHTNINLPLKNTLELAFKTCDIIYEDSTIIASQSDKSVREKMHLYSV